MKLKKLGCVVAIVGVAGTSVGGCAYVEEQTGLGTKAQVGTAGGAAAGGLIAAAAGASPAWIAGSVILGAIAGGVLGNYLDERDKELAYQAQQRALSSNKTGQTSSWQNPDNDHQGTYTPKSGEYPSGNTTCRDFEQTVTIGGETETATGTACKASDGTWRIQS